jgi:malate dehydrogenase (oxaloacetate-decarboxylating)(NADP+)
MPDIDPARARLTDQEALDFHREPTPGKIAIVATKPMATQRDLALAYSPGVAAPVRAIAANPAAVYDYTSKGNLVAVVTNGTAILGLGDLGPAAAKPVMEGKSVLFKRFADIDSVDIEIGYKDVDRFVECVAGFGDTFGGINLEDIAAPECFEIEARLRAALDIPVFHDDQHGTAIIASAALINACDVTGRRMQDLRVCLIGGGAAGLSVLALIERLGVQPSNVVVVDKGGVVHRGRNDLHPTLAAHAIDTRLRTLSEAVAGADCLIGLSAGGVVTADMVKTMAKNPIIFAMANPTPEITPEEVAAVRPDAIMATGRSDYPNQVNNVLGFPYIFRGALDVRARTINEEMKLAAAHALAELARQDVPDEVAAAYQGERLQYGPKYLIPTPFDPRLISWVPPYVARAAADTGVARKPLEDEESYVRQLDRRLDPTAAVQQRVAAGARAHARTIVFAEGEEPSVIRAAFQFQNAGLGKAILVAREQIARDNMRVLGLPDDTLEIWNARLSDRNGQFVDFLYERLQRRGYLKRDVQRLVNTDRNVFSACMVACGMAHGMITGYTRHADVAMRDVLLVLDPAPDNRIIGLSVCVSKGRTLVIGDVSVTEFPTAEELADIAIGAAQAARRLGLTPRVAFMSFSNFGNPLGERAEKLQHAVKILDKRGVDFEYEGEMSPDLALDPSHHALYPFSRLTDEANVLIMPAVHSASIATRLLKTAGGANVIGPVLVGFEKPIQICRLGAPVSEIVALAAFAAYDLSETG